MFVVAAGNSSIKVSFVPVFANTYKHSKLAMFQCKEDKKNLRAKVKHTVLFKNKASNLETQKLTKRIEIHQSQITNDDLLFPKRFAKM